jgi:hypothetical protein
MVIYGDLILCFYGILSDAHGILWQMSGKVMMDPSKFAGPISPIENFHGFHGLSQTLLRGIEAPLGQKGLLYLEKKRQRRNPLHFLMNSW